MGSARFGLYALIGFLFFSACSSPTKKKIGSVAPTSAKEQSQLKMTDMHVQSYGDAGLAWEMKAPYGEVYTQQNLMRVKSMHAQLFDGGEKSTEINAKQAFMATGDPVKEKPAVKPDMFDLNLDSGDMYLSGDVVMVSTDGTRFTTDWAHYISKRDLIVSSAPVRVERDDSITTGIGMEASSDMTQVHIFNETLIIPEKPQEGRP